jgi:ABC-type transporter Mla MlaB component
VLRISIITNADKSIRLGVEGWLVGPWVEELRQQSERALAESQRVTLDLEKLLFVDVHGAALLRQLADRQVAHLNCSAFISQQLKETNP